MKERKQFTKEFKEGAVRLGTDQGQTIGNAASEYFAPAEYEARYHAQLNEAA